MAKRLYVGNLSYSVTGVELKSIFSPYGTVISAEVVADRDTGQSKGFGFVEMAGEREAQAAIQGLGGQQHDGRALTVNEAKPRVDKTGPRHREGGY
jgi:RNA recognition motif-containing protein